MLLVLYILLIVFYCLVLRVLSVYLSLNSMYVTTSISIGLYPNLDLWNANKLYHITLHYITYFNRFWHGRRLGGQIKTMILCQREILQTNFILC
jgi:hypothetical protein